MAVNTDNSQEELDFQFDLTETEEPLKEEGQPEDQKEEEEEKEEQQDSSEESGSFLEDHFKALVENNLLQVPEDFKFDGTIEKFLEANQLYYNSLKDAAKNEILESIPEKNRSLVEAALSGVDIDVEAPVNKLAEIEKHFKSKGIGDDEVALLVANLQTSNKIDEAFSKIQTARLKEEQIKKEKADQEKAQALIEEAKKEKERLDTAFKVMQEELRWNAQKVRTVKELLTTPSEDKTMSKADYILQQVINDPKSMPLLVEFLSYYKNGKFDLNAYRGTESKEVEKVKTSLEKHLTNKKPFSGSGGIDRQQEFDIERLDF